MKNKIISIFTSLTIIAGVLIPCFAFVNADEGRRNLTHKTAVIQNFESYGSFDEFKDFISRGNVVDMAVGVVVGGAFKSIVDSLVADIINPGIAYVVSLITGALKTAATSTVGDTSAVESVMDMSKWIIPGTSINIGNFLSAIINFLILAFIIFCVVKGLNKLNDKFKKKVEEEVTPAGPTQEELLAEIRDLLKDKE